MLCIQARQEDLEMLGLKPSFLANYKNHAEKNKCTGHKSGVKVIRTVLGQKARGATVNISRCPYHKSGTAAIRAMCCGAKKRRSPMSIDHQEEQNTMPKTFRGVHVH